MSDQEFLFDDFFFNDEDTVPVEVEVRGRKIPFQLKKGVNAADLTSAKRVAMRLSFKEDGTPVVGDVDAAAFENELLARCIKGWPFKNADGSPVEITRANVGMLSGDVVQAVSQKIMLIMQKGQAALSPLGKPSADPS